MRYLRGRLALPQRHRACALATLALIAIGLLGSMSPSYSGNPPLDPEFAAAAAQSGKIVRAVIVAKKSQVFEVDAPYATALVADNEIADVVPLSDHSVYILGKKVGATRVTIVGKDQRVIELVEVDVTPDIDDLRAMLQQNIPGADIGVSTINGGIVLTGSVFDATTIEQAVAIAKRYAPDGVTNALTVASPQQVMLEVRFVEASRKAGRELGISARGRSNDVNVDTNGNEFFPFVGTALQSAAFASGAAPFGTLLARILEGGTDVDVMIRALETRDLARRLAEPNLVTTSGDTASFLAGGEFPFPVGTKDGQIMIEFKQFGVALAFTPTVLNAGLINLKIAPEVSDIDLNNTVEISNIRIPGLTVRRANTTVELKDGQSIAIAGLLQHAHRTNQQQLPWIGQVPVLGALFRSSEYQKEETDLVIIVTPRLVKPARPGENLRTPLDSPVSGNDPDFFLNGRSEVTEKDLERGEQRQYGHIISTGGERVSYAPSK
jgi:pilus assembly protein CpaC